MAKQEAPKCDSPTKYCGLHFCKKTEVCKRYFSSLPAEERLAMRLRWVPILENFTVGDILTTEEYKKYSSKKNQPVTVSVSVKKETKKINTKYSYNKLKRDKVWERDQGICWLCGVKTSIRQFTIDHVMPLSKGGTDAMKNLKVACGDCNSIKSDRIIKDRNEFFNQLTTKEKARLKSKSTALSEFEKARLSNQINSNHQ